jgi:diguanylate cyclase (GGDEF)-like protein/PAS domain S-box-containing protein
MKGFRRSMSQGKPARQTAAGEEVSTLLATLHDTVQRLEALTAHQANALLERVHPRFLAAQRRETSLVALARQVEILDALPAPVALLDGQGMILSSNRAWRSEARHALLGPACATGANYISICAAAVDHNASDARKVAAGIRAVVGGCSNFAMEYSTGGPGATRCFLLTVTPAGAAPLRGAVVMHVDITERTRIGLALRQQQTDLRMLIDLLPAMIWFKDTHNRILRINQRAAAAAEMPVDQIEGRLASEVYPQHAASYYADDLEVMHSGLPMLGIVERVHVGAGKDIWIETNKVPVRDEHGAVTGICVMSHDISARKRADQALRESERRFSDLLNNIELAAVMLDCDAHITYCNGHLLRLSGWQMEEVLGRDWFDVFMPPVLGDMRPVFKSLLANLPEAWHRENEIFTRSGERRLFRWSNSLLRGEDGEVVGTASVGEDITDQRLAELRVKRLNRVYAVLSGINSLIVRVHDRDELFKGACQIAHTQGQFKMAWIGIVDNRTRSIVPVAAAGADLEFMALTAAGPGLRHDMPLHGDTLTARAVRYRKAMVTNEISGDTTMVLSEESVARGILSMAILPLLLAGEAIGVLALYADESDFFDYEELKLLSNLAADIGFAVDHIEKQERLDYLAYYDVLTGLANRRLFLERVAQYTRDATSGKHKLAVALLDLERFKNINDTLGQGAGDELLRQVAAWLTGNVSDASLLARVGADLFAVVLPRLTTEADASRLIQKSTNAFLEHSFQLNGSDFRIAAKIGVALFPDDGVDAEALFKNAEIALKKAKSSGARHTFFTGQMTEAVAGKLDLENQLRNAVRNAEFVLHYQPKINLASGAVTGVEALIRWNKPQVGLVPPAQFIPVLEQTGLILEVGEWALRQAVADHRRWRAQGLNSVRIAVNVSSLQLRQLDFIAKITHALGDNADAADILELEITESLIMEDIDYCIASLRAIRAMGVTVAIDDFGTGFSSLSYLARLPIDTLKVDGSFVAGITAGPKGLALVSTIISLGHALQLKVVAEGVETDTQSRLLGLVKCDELQGFLVSRPLPAEILESTWLVPASARQPVREPRPAA